jgi:hypothetical protein
MSSVHLRAALQCKAPLSEDEVARFRARWRDEMNRCDGKTVVLEPGERIDLFQPSGIGRWSVVRPPPLPWYYVCDPMILLALIAGAVMVPIVLIIMASA